MQSGISVIDLLESDSFSQKNSEETSYFSLSLQNILTQYGINSQKYNAQAG